jgi:hypothetical protein
MLGTETPNEKITISKKKLYGIGLIITVVAITALLLYYRNVSSMNKLEIAELSASGFNLPFTTVYGWDVTLKIRNVGSNDVQGVEIKSELVCDGVYLDTETKTIDKLSVGWERTTTISVMADRTTTNVLSANQRKIIITITLNGVVLDQRTLNL